MKEVEKELADKMADDLFSIVKEEVKNIESDEGGFNSGHLWNLTRKLRPKLNNKPTAMLNQEGKLVTSHKELKDTAMEHFKKILENRPIKAELKDHQVEREKLCVDRIKLASKVITIEKNLTDSNVGGRKMQQSLKES